MFVSDERVPEVRRLPDAAVPALQRQQEVRPQKRPLRKFRRAQVNRFSLWSSGHRASKTRFFCWDRLRGYSYHLLPQQSEFDANFSLVYLRYANALLLFANRRATWNIQWECFISVAFGVKFVYAIGCCWCLQFYWWKNLENKRKRGRGMPMFDSDWLFKKLWTMWVIKSNGIFLFRIVPWLR